MVSSATAAVEAAGVRDPAPAPSTDRQRRDASEQCGSVSRCRLDVRSHEYASFVCGARHSGAPGEQGPTRRTHECCTVEPAPPARYADGREHGRTPLTLKVVESKATAFASVMCHRCEQPLRVVLPAHRLGDCAGRSPGSRVNACRPAFPVSQWLTRTTGSPLTVAGAATASVCLSQTTRVPSCLPGATRGTSTMVNLPACARASRSVRRTRRRPARNSAGCCAAATD